MKRVSPMRQRLAALSLFGFVMLTYPLLGLSGAGKIAGIPSAYLYLFGVWLAIILIAGLIAEQRRK
jgi:Na+/proline symporter